MHRSVEYLQTRHVSMKNKHPLLILMVLMATSSCFSLELDCSEWGWIGACEIKEAVPASPFEYGDTRDRNFSSPSKKLQGGGIKRGVREEKVGGKSENGGSFEATISGRASAEQRNAVKFCMERAAENWISAVGVKVLVKFEDLGVANLLGSAQPSRNWVVRDFICPVSLAEAILGRDLNNASTTEELTYDIWMTLNSEARWYTGTDANTPIGRYDLVTVCLHETYHGLFMSGGNIGVNAEADGSYTGLFYHPRYRGRFDSFMANQDECQIIGYSSKAEKLGAVLTGNNLWFAEAERRIGRLHAPRPYRAGSSLYHLSEWEYGEGTDDNDLMTPAIGSNYGQHNIGKVVLEMQKMVMDVERKSGAKVCDELRDPESDDGTIDQGSGGGAGQGGDEGTGDSTKNSGFFVKLGGTLVSGWVLVGCGVGAVAVVGLLVGLVLRSEAAERRKKAVAKRARRERRAEERIDFEIGNGGGVV